MLAIVFVAPFLKSGWTAKDLMTPFALIAAFLLIVLYLPYRVGKKMVAGKGAGAHRTVDISDEGITSRTDSSDSRLSWTGVSKWIENRRVFVLYLSPVSFFPIPKRAMSEAQAADLRELLKQHVSAK